MADASRSAHRNRNVVSLVEVGTLTRDSVESGTDGLKSVVWSESASESDSIDHKRRVDVGPEGLPVGSRVIEDHIVRFGPVVSLESLLNALFDDVCVDLEDVHHFVRVLLSDSSLVNLVDSPHVLQVDALGTLLYHVRVGLGNLGVLRLLVETVLSEVLEQDLTTSDVQT